MKAATKRILKKLGFLAKPVEIEEEPVNYWDLNDDPYKEEIGHHLTEEQEIKIGLKSIILKYEN